MVKSYFSAITNEAWMVKSLNLSLEPVIKPSASLQKLSFDLKMVHCLLEVYSATCTAMDQQLLLFLSQILRKEISFRVAIVGGKKTLDLFEKSEPLVIINRCNIFSVSEMIWLRRHQKVKAKKLVAVELHVVFFFLFCKYGLYLSLS